jgi:PAS domain S-box-containing protein
VQWSNIVQPYRYIPLAVVFIFGALLTLFYSLGIYTPVFQPPYVFLVLNTVFLTFSSLVVAFISAKSYLNGASFNILILGSAFLVNGLAACVAGWVFSFDVNYTVMIYNSCTLLSAVLQLVNAAFIPSGLVARSKKSVLIRRLGASYIGSALVILLVSAVAVNGLAPTFFVEGSGATLTDISVLAASILFFGLSAIILLHRHMRSNSKVMFWYALGLALFSIGLLGVSLERNLGDPLGWTGKIAQYVGGLFFLVAVSMSHRNKENVGISYSQGWAAAFKADQTQVATFFSKIAEGFAYCKIVIDKAGKPIDWVYLDVNDAYEQINAIEKEAVLGKKATEVLPDLNQDPADWVNLYGQVALTGEPFTCERFAQVRNKWYHISAYSPKRGYFVSVFEDITERKKTEEALKESEERLRFATEGAHIGLWDLDLVDHTAIRSAEHSRIFGYDEPTKDWSLTDFVGHILPEYRVGFQEVMKKGIAERHGWSYECQIRRVDGEARWIMVSGRLYSAPSGHDRVAGIIQDITERKKAEEALQRQADLIDLSPDAIIVRKLDGTITFWSKGAEKLYGWTKAEVLGKKTHDVFETKFPVPFDSILSELKAKRHWTGELIHKTKLDEEVIVQSWWLAEKTDHGEITSILESNVDLTERKKAEKEIARLASFPTLNPNPVIEVTFAGQLTYVNPATKAIYPDLEKTQLNHPFFSDWTNIIKTFERKNVNTFSREIEIEDHWYHQQFYLVPQTESIRIYTTDIDDLKQAEQARARAQAKLEENAVLLEEYATQMEQLAQQRALQLQNAERLAAIGQTAGMVGHDIRNPLQAITGDMYLIAEEAKTLENQENKASILESVDSVNQNIFYINKIVSDLQDYTRPLTPNLQKANLSELVASILSTINIPPEMAVTVDIKETAKPIQTDIVYLRRVLTNLFTNAVQAMPDKGSLTVMASKKKGKIILTVEDTGVGIPEAAKSKMFMPLFTTKSKGQGLGLAVVKRLVEALGGTISFESQENKGTKFIVELPQTR